MQAPERPALEQDRVARVKVVAGQASLGVQSLQSLLDYVDHHFRHFLRTPAETEHSQHARGQVYAAQHYLLQVDIHKEVTREEGHLLEVPSDAARHGW